MAIISTRSRKTALPKTEQTVSYPNGDATDRDDGHYQSGSLIIPRFIDNGDGTISDKVAGFMWVKAPQLIIPGAVGVHATNQIQAARGNWANNTAYVAADVAKDTVDSTYWVCAVAHTSHAAVYTFAEDRTDNPTYWRQSVWTSSAANLTTSKTASWLDAITNCEALEYAGYTNWHLPNVKELESIVDFSTYSPAINVTFFPNVPNSYYWSSTTYIHATANAFLVDFYIGNVTNLSKLNGYYIRPVRNNI